MRIVVASDKFRGTLDSLEAGRAIAAGIERCRPDAEVSIHAIADGGEGTIDALSTVPGARIDKIRVTGPDGADIEARVLRLGDVRVLESCEVTRPRSGPGPRASLEATSFGLGGAITQAATGAEVVVAIGGTGSSDGGSGMAHALGWRFLDARGHDLPGGGGALVDLATVVSPARPLDVTVTGLRDIDAPLLGERGAARVYGPQKGAGPLEVERLEHGLSVLAEVVRRDVGIDMTGVAGGAAGGGIGAGLWAFLGAELVSGFERIAETTALTRTIEHADLVITGEGRFDEGSLGGKAPVGVAAIAARAGVPCTLVAGSIVVSDAELRRAGFSTAASLEQVVGERIALEQPEQSLIVATVELINSGGY